METPRKVVVLPFPFSDLSTAKRRPALVLASVGSDVILCQITSKERRDKYSILLEQQDFVAGGLHQASVIKPHKLFTADKSLVLYSVGTISQEKRTEVLLQLNAIFSKCL